MNLRSNVAEIHIHIKTFPEPRAIHYFLLTQARFVHLLPHAPSLFSLLFLKAALLFFPKSIFLTLTLTLITGIGYSDTGRYNVIDSPFNIELCLMALTKASLERSLPSGHPRSFVTNMGMAYIRCASQWEFVFVHGRAGRLGLRCVEDRGWRWQEDG